jgi:hypothetical protein
MTVEPAAVPSEEEPERPARHHADAAHLDEDPEALEDPVHSGDAQHQHELHTRPPAPDG